MTSTADTEFREFAAGFGEPLARLAYVLIAGTGGDDDADLARAEALTIEALARTRRRWREVDTHGLPESIAVEALLSRLPRSRRTSARPADPPPVLVDAAGEPLDPAALRDAMWVAWCSLEPRQRVPLVFDDPAVIAPQLRGLDVPQTFASTRRLLAWQQRASETLLGVWKAVTVGVRSASRADMPVVLRDGMHSHAAGVRPLIDAYGRAGVAVRRLRTRARSVAAGATAACAAVAAVVVVISSGGGGHPAAAPSPSASRPSPGATSAGSSPPATSLFTALDPAQDLVVEWPLRGNAATDVNLLYNLRGEFLHAHPDATGLMQVLLADDTAGFRVAYVTARAGDTVVGSWFYGPVGADSLFEGAVTSAPATIVTPQPVAAIISDPRAGGILVALGPPGSIGVQVTAEGAGTSVVRQRYPADDGVVVAPVGGIAGPSVLLAFEPVSTAGAAWTAVGPLTRFTRGEPPAGQDPSVSGWLPGQPLPAGHDEVSPSAVVLQRGRPDARQLALALSVVKAWKDDGDLSATVLPSVLWAGSDGAGEQVLVLRARTRGPTDLLTVVWSGATSGEGEYVMAAGTPDYPFAFLYGGADRARIGVLGTAGTTGAMLLADDEAQAATNLRSDRFGSMPVVGSVAEVSQQSFVVGLQDGAGQIVTSIPVPPDVLTPSAAAAVAK